MPIGKYREKAANDARVIARVNLFDEIVAETMKRKGPTDKVFITDYPSGYLHTPEAPRLSLWEACDLLVELDEFEETDSGNWKGKNTREALVISAGLTYRNAVNTYFTKIIDQINDVLGNMTIPWTLQERYMMEAQQANTTGVLDWDPDAKALEILPPEEIERLQARHQQMLLQEMQVLLSRAIQNQ